MHRVESGVWLAESAVLDRGTAPHKTEWGSGDKTNAQLGSWAFVAIQGDGLCVEDFDVGERLGVADLMFGQGPLVQGYGRVQVNGVEVIVFALPPEVA